MAVETLGFLVFATSQVGTPGPANMTLLAAGARFGLRPALPFVAGVALGKQLIIWPIGLGLMGLAAGFPILFAALKWASVAYILWLAWRIAGSSLTPKQADITPPGLIDGLWVHPLNPKAWGMIATGFTSFVEPGTPAIGATFVIAVSLLCVQCVLHPLWCLGGQHLARLVAGTIYERSLMISLAVLTVASVIYVVVK